MNNLLNQLGIAAWKPFISVLLLPPVPWLLLVVLGARLLRPRRGVGWSLVLLGVAGVWMSSCVGTAYWIEDHWLKPPPALSAARAAELKSTARGGAPTAIVVLGSGVQPLAPEYGTANLSDQSLERLRYGVWLGRATGLPLAFSGGVGWGGAAVDGASEAEVAARIAKQEFGHALRWTESTSRDTRENAAYSLALLGPAGVRHIVLVTHGWHMARALRAFNEAAAARLPGLQIEAAPMGLARGVARLPLDWLPSAAGMVRFHQALHEVLGLALGG